MRKVIVCFGLMLLFAGCTNNSSNENSTSSGLFKKSVVKGEIYCTVEDSSFTLMLEDGQIVKYIDSVDGELGQETVDILNEEHLVGVTDNDEVLRIMDATLSELGGSCSK